jgi:hypothetical protein
MSSGSRKRDFDVQFAAVAKVIARLSMVVVLQRPARHAPPTIVGP